MINLYYKMIKNGLLTIGQVPEAFGWRAAVQKLLDADEAQRRDNKI